MLTEKQIQELQALRDKIMQSIKDFKDNNHSTLESILESMTLMDKRMDVLSERISYVHTIQIAIIQRLEHVEQAILTLSSNNEA